MVRIVESGEDQTINVKPEDNVDIPVDDAGLPLLIPQESPPNEVPTTVQQYVNENGETSYIELAADGSGNEQYYVQGDHKPIEEYLVDTSNVCCGICGEVMSYGLLMSHHLPAVHPELFADGEPTFQEVTYDSPIKSEVKSYYNSNEHLYYHHQKQNRPLRKVSQIRVKTSTMSLEDLESCLERKMVEKLGREVPVTLVDKTHARCGLCNAVVSLNKKFEIVHLVRHFNAWHPSAHQCAGQWGEHQLSQGYKKALSGDDIAVIDTQLGAHDNLQCIWCGMFMDGSAVGMHFHEVHADEIEVPKCNLCLQELLINARLTERYGDNFAVVMPDERHYKCLKYDTTHSSEQALERAIIRWMQRELNDGGAPENEENEEEEEDGENMQNISNSRMAFGRRSKPKRQFIKPSLRQAVPVDSQFIEPVTDCHWKCKICGKDILAAVISAGTIKHYRDHHPNELSDCQMELCRTRLEKLSGGCMEFLNPDEIKCCECNLTYPLHKSFNMCRAIRHLKVKHPEKMPEYEGTTAKSEPSAKKRRLDDGIEEGEDITPKYEITDEATLNDLRDKYKIEFTKVLGVQTSGNDQVYILVNGDTSIDQHSLDQILLQLEGAEPQYDGSPYVVQYAPQGIDDNMMENAQDDLSNSHVKQEVFDEGVVENYADEEQLPNNVRDDLFHNGNADHVVSADVDIKAKEYFQGEPQLNNESPFVP